MGTCGIPLMCERLEGRVLLADTASLLSAGSFNSIQAAGTQTQRIGVVYFGGSVGASTFGDANLAISGPMSFPGTIRYAGLGNVDPSLVGLEKIALYDITDTFDASNDGQTYSISVAPNQVSDGQGGTFPAQALESFTIAIPMVPPITLLNRDGTPLASGSTIDFGHVAFSTPVTKTFLVRNDGLGPIFLVNVSAADETNQFSHPFVAGTTATLINSGQSVPFTITLDAKGGGLVGTGAVSDLVNISEGIQDPPYPFASYLPRSLNVTGVIDADVSNAGGKRTRIVGIVNVAEALGKFFAPRADFTGRQFVVGKSLGVLSLGDVPGFTQFLIGGSLEGAERTSAPAARRRVEHHPVHPHQGDHRSLQPIRRQQVRNDQGAVQTGPDAGCAVPCWMIEAIGHTRREV